MKKGLIKAGVFGFFILFIFGIIFFIIFSSTTSGEVDTSKDSIFFDFKQDSTYVLGTVLKFDLSKMGNYEIIIMNPSGERNFRIGSNDRFSIDLLEEGNYSIYFKRGNEKKSYSFAVVSSSSNIPLIPESPLNTPTKGELIQEKAEINKNVRWKKTVNETLVEIPEITNLTIKKNNGEVFSNYEVIESNEKRYVQINEYTLEQLTLEYSTGPPKIEEISVSENKKEVVIYSPEEISYQDVLSYTNLPKETQNKKSIQIYWKENNTYIDFNASDTNENGLLDYIEWIVPHLSNQTFEIIIITNAEHLSPSREFISDIYNEVKELDDIWSEKISEGDYVRITFEIPLDNTRDITLYPRIISGNPVIEVYEKDSTEKIAEFNPLTNNNYNKVYLTNLQEIQDTFDLRIVGGNVEFDHIIDPNFYARTGVSSYTANTPTSISFSTAMPDADYSILFSGQQDTDAIFSIQYDRKAATGFRINRINDDGGANESAGVEWAALSFGEFDFQNISVKCNSGSGSSTSTINFESSFPDTNYAVVAYTPWDADSPRVSYSSKSAGSWNSVILDDGGAAEAVSSIDWCAVSYGTETVGGIIIKSGNDTASGATSKSISLGSSFPNTNYVVLTTASRTGTADTCEIEVSGKTTTSFSVTAEDDDTRNNCNGREFSWIAISTGEFFLDLTSPTFIKIPQNSSIFYRNESLGVDFDATDDIEFGYYSVNDTRFSINQSGFLSNATSLAVGNYEINVTINDTANNINWTRYTVQINKSSYYDCGVYFNATSPITYPETFIAYTNCSSGYTFYLNGTITSNNSLINSGAGYYNLTVQRTDTQNYSKIIDTQFFTVNKNPENCQVLFNATSPLTYPDTFLVWANCTTPFTLYRNGTLISNNSEQVLSVSAYNFSMFRTDTQNYSMLFNQTQFRIVDTIPPYFTKIPDNESLFYGNESLGVDFDATDDIEFGYYSVNDTRFSINQSGFLSNATSLAVGNYEINVTINDTANNINWTRYTVQINKSSYYDCGVYFNATSPITYPETFIAYTNCSSGYTFYLNGTITSNNSLINSGAGYYNLTVQRTDTANYTNIINTQFFTVNKNPENFQVLFNSTSPLTYPDTFLVWANATSTFTLYRDGTIILNNSEQINGAGYFNFTAQRTDTSNYSFIYNTSFFTLNKNPENCQVLFNATSPLNYSDVFLVWANCTTPFTLYRNGTFISNNSEQELAVGIYNFSMMRDDFFNYSIYYNETQFAIIDLENPNATLVSPENNTYLNSSLQNFTLNASDNYGLSNMTLFVYNETNLINETTQDISGTDIITGIVYNFLYDGIFKWFYNIFDLSGNNFQTQNNTIIIDTTYSLISFSSSTEENNANFSRTWIYVNLSVTELNEANVTFNLYDSGYNLFNSSTYNDSRREINWTDLNDGVYYYNVTVIDLAYNINSTLTRKIGLDTVGPTVDILEPELKAYSYNSSLPLTYTIRDNVAGVSMCWWNIDNQVNQTIACGTNTTFDTSEGTHSLNFYSNDTLNHLSIVEVSFSVSTTGPAITLVTPTNKTYFNSLQNNFFNFTAMDSDGLGFCSLYGTWNGGWHNNQTLSWSSWYHSEWNKRRQINVSSSKITANLTNFPMLIDIYDAALHDYSRTDGYDILFTSLDGKNKLNHEIELFDKNYNSTHAHLIAWIKVNLSSVSNNVFYMYYNNSNSANQQNPSKVWDSNYMMVQHLEETGTGSRVDSTSNGRNMTSAGYEGDEAITGKVDGADNLDGSNDMLNSTSNFMSNLGSFTLEGWIYPRAWGSRVSLYGQNDVTEFFIDGTNTVMIWTSGGGSTSTSYTYGVNSWHHVVAVGTGTNLTLYFDGSPASSGGSSTASYGSSAYFVKIGEGVVDASGGYFNGTFDEIRVSNTSRSPVWINASFQNQNNPSSFYTLGGETTSPSLSFLVNLSVDGNYLWNVRCNDTLGSSAFAFINNTFVLDNTFPQIDFVYPTDINGSNKSQNWIYINTSITELNPKNITFNLYFSNYTLVNSTTYTDTTRTSINFTSLLDNSYLYDVTVFDMVNLSNTTSTRKITLDTTKPLIDYSSPTENNYANFSRNWIYINTSITELNPKNITFNLYFSNYTLVNSTTYTDTTRTSINFTSLLDNSYLYNVTVFDMVNLSNTTSTRKITLDTLPPFVDFGIGTANNNTKFARLWIYVNTSVIEEHEANITFNLYNSAHNLINSSTYLDKRRTINWTNLEEGFYYYNITVFDFVNLSNSTSTRKINLNLTLPSINFIFPTEENLASLSRDWVYVNTSTSNVNEEINVTFGLYNLSGLVNESIYTDSRREINWTNLQQGLYYYNVTLFDDLDGEFLTLTRAITLDTNNPNATLVSPENETYANSTLQNLTVNANDNLGLSNMTLFLYNETNLINETTQDISGTDIITGIVYNFLYDGIFKWFYKIFDLAGNSFQTQNNTITIDTTYPQIVYSLLTENDYSNFSRNWIYVNVSVIELNEANITFRLNYLNGTLVNSTVYTDSRREINWTNLPDAIYYYNVILVDLAYNVNSTSTRQIGLDTTPPNATLISPLNNSYVNSSSQNLTVNLTDNLKLSNLTLSVYNQTHLINQTIQNISGTNLLKGIIYNLPSEGFFSWNYKVSDIAGNTFGSSNNSFYYDGTTPQISYTFPTENDNTNFSRTWIYINTSIVESNFANITFNLYNSENILVNSSSYNDSRRFINFTSLPDGIYYYNVTILDLAYNINFTSTRKIGLDNTGPTVIIISPEPKVYAYNTSLPLNYTIYDNVVGLSMCWWNLDNQANQSISCGTNTTFDTTEATHTLYFYSNDTFGNIALAKRTFSISIYGPAVSLFSPEDNSYFTSFDDEEFHFNFSDADGISYCSLYGTWNGGWHNNQTKEINWYSSGWSKRKLINITNPSLYTLEQNYSMLLTLDTTGSDFLDNGDDLRIVYWNGSQNIELDRYNSTAFDDPSTEIWFRIQAPISAGKFDDNYYIYHSNSDASNPKNNGSNVFEFFEDFNRPNSDTVGNGWTETRGTWAILNNRVRNTLDGDSDLTRTTVTGNHSIRAIVNHETSDSDWKLMARMPSASGNGYVYGYQNNYLQLSSTGHTLSNLGSYGFSPSVGTDYELELNTFGNRIVAYEDGNLIFNLTDSTYASGTSGLHAWATEQFDDVWIRKLIYPEPSYNEGDEELYYAINFSLALYEDGVYLWNIKCNDSLGYDGWALNNFTFTFDSTYPLISYSGSTENDTSNKSQTWVYVNTSVIEENEVNITFNLYYSNYTVYNSSTYTDSRRIINWTNLPEGSYYYNVTIFDVVNYSNTTETRKITLDTIPPNVNLLTENNSNFTGYLIPFLNYSVNDSNDVVNCTLYGTWDGIWHANETTSYPEKGASLNFSNKNVVTDGYYLWNILCFDNSGNFAFNSTNFTFAAFLPPDSPLTDISQTKNDGTGDIFLSWNTSAHAYKYRIYYTENASIAFALLNETFNLNYTDSNANQSRRRFYRISSWNPIAENFTNSTFGKTVYYIQSKPSINTRNWMGLYIETNITDSKEALGEINNITSFTMWNSTIQKRVTCNNFSCPDYPGCTLNNCNFNLEDGRGYEMNLNLTSPIFTNWSLVGAVKSPVEVDLIKNSTSFGKNWVSLYYNSSKTNAYNLISSVSYSDAVTNWNSFNQTSQGYISTGSPVPWIPPYIGTNFIIEPEKGYEVSVTQNSLYTQA